MISWIVFVMVAIILVAIIISVVITQASGYSLGQYFGPQIPLSDKPIGGPELGTQSGANLK